MTTCKTIYISMHKDLLQNKINDLHYTLYMGAAWVGILPRQGVWGHSPAEATDFSLDFFGLKF